jgi:hypothetical protein
VEIQSTDDGGYAMDDEAAIERLQKERVRRIDAVIVPPAYNSRSTLTESVNPDTANEFTFHLTSSTDP